jgi:hypothetical protein
MKFSEKESSNVDHIHLTREQKVELQVDSLGEKLKLVINRLPPEGVTLFEILDLVGKDSLMLHRFPFAGFPHPRFDSRCEHAFWRRHPADKRQPTLRPQPVAAEVLWESYRIN